MTSLASELSAYKIPHIVLALAAALFIFKYAFPSRPTIQTKDGFTPLPPAADDQEKITRRRSSVNADIQDIRMRRQVRMKAGWRARSWNKSELVPPKSRRWEG